MRTQSFPPPAFDIPFSCVRSRAPTNALLMKAGLGQTTRNPRARASMACTAFSNVRTQILPTNPVPIQYPPPSTHSSSPTSCPLACSCYVGLSTSDQNRSARFQCEQSVTAQVKAASTRWAARRRLKEKSSQRASRRSDSSTRASWTASLRQEILPSRSSVA